MAVVEELIRNEADGSVSFGDYSLKEKAKKEDFAHGNDTMKVKTCAEITRLEKNGLVLYESVPGTTVNNLSETEDGLRFSVEGPEDAQITLGLLEDTGYDIKIAGKDSGMMRTNLGGKLSFGVELAGSGAVEVEVKKA
ncbi:MAG: endosialidase [Lachnospiraceae bacterium]|jgi:hypothetical protein|nr:endosialidase [Lachnospiraceae bacterium]